MRRNNFLATAVLVLLWSLSFQSAEAAINVNCSVAGQTIGKAIAATGPTSGPLVISVSGHCVENITIPVNIAVDLVGAPGASITAANPNNITVFALGFFQSDGMAIVGGNAAAVWVYGGRAVINGGNISGAGYGVSVEGGGALLNNVTVAVTGYSAVNVSSGGSVEINGVANAWGANGSTFSSTSDGIFCEHGAVALSSGPGASIVIEKSRNNGINSWGCGLSLHGDPKGPIMITKIGLPNQYSFAIQMNGGNAWANNFQVVSNAGMGLSVQVGASMRIEGAAMISGNKGAAVQASAGGVIDFLSFRGPNTVTGVAGQPLFGCYQSGKIFADVSATITPPVTSSTKGCLQIGGP